MSGKHSTKKRPDRSTLVDASVARIQEMPDPDNLRIDVSKLPMTGPISVPRRD